MTVIRFAPDGRTFAIEPYLALPPEDDGHPLADVVEVEDAEQLVLLLLQDRISK